MIKYFGNDPFMEELSGSQSTGDDMGLFILGEVVMWYSIFTGVGNTPQVVAIEKHIP